MTQPMPETENVIMVPMVSVEEWEKLTREVHEIHTFIAEFAVRMEALGSAAGNPMALLQMISGGGKVKRKP